MSEFIGSRISLISKSDIRYVGTLHEINSETSTVALENVTSFGTEGRKKDPEEEIPGSDSVYEYIVFRGSDVKDLRIEEPPKENKPPPPQVPNDPAILGSGSRPQGPNGQPPQMPPGGPHHNNNFPPGPPFPNQFPNPYGGPPGGPGFGPPGRGFPGYGPPPHFGGPGGWHGGPPPPPPGAPNYPGGPGGPGQYGGPFSPQQQQPNFAFGGPGPQQLTHQHQRQQHSQGPGQQQQSQQQPPAQAAKNTTQLKQDGVKPPPTGPAADKQPGAPAPQGQAGPRPPVESKPDTASALAPANNKPAGPKSNRIMPAVPLATPGARQGPKFSSVAAGDANIAQQKQPQGAAAAAMQHQDATTQAATAAVAAAMAKLSNPGAPSAAVDNLTQRVNEMRVEERNRSSDGFRGRGRGGRRGGRGGARGIEVPNSDFDFASANAKFDKTTVAKQAGTSSVTAPGADGAEDVNGGGDDIVIPPAEPAYSKDSFFDSLSREDTADASRGGRGGGQTFRREDRKLNMETFGMSSVDYGRGGHRGRGRGRGFGQGNGFRGRGRGGPRGPADF